MNKRAALLMLLPAIVLYLLAFAGPLVMVGRLSLFQTNYITSVFVGGANFVKAVTDHYFLKSFVNAFIFVGMMTPPIIIGSYLIASFLMGFDKKTQAVGRFVIYIPGLTSGLIMGLLWGWLLLREGLVNGFIVALGGQAVSWLSEPWTARMSMALMSVSSGLGGYVIMFAAYMHSIPLELHDAAMIDGASERQYKRFIVRPILMPAIMLCLLLAIVGILQIWESVYVLMGEGGPEGSASTPVYEIFLTAFRFGKAGLAAAKGLILLVVIAAILFVKQRVEKLLT